MKWDDLVMRGMLAALAFFLTLAVSALVAGAVQQSGGSLGLQLLAGFGPPVIAAVVMWRLSRDV